MVSFDGSSPFSPLLKCDSHIVVNPNSANFLSYLSGPSLAYDIASSSHVCIYEASMSYLALHINILYGYGNSYLPIFKKLEESLHMYIGKSIEIDINDDPRYTKIVYVGDILTKLEKEKSTTILRICSKIFTFGYQDMLGIDPNVFIYNIIMYIDPRPIRKKSRKLHHN